MSQARRINGESPQGTKLGNILFCLTVENIEIAGDGLAFGAVGVDGSADVGSQEDQRCVIPRGYHSSMDVMSPLPSAVPEEYRGTACTSTPCLNDSLNKNIFRSAQGTRNKKNVIREEVHERSIGILGEERNKWSLMYIDDLTIGEIPGNSKNTSHTEEGRKNGTCKTL